MHSQVLGGLAGEESSGGGSPAQAWPPSGALGPTRACGFLLKDDAQGPGANWEQVVCLADATEWAVMLAGQGRGPKDGPRGQGFTCSVYWAPGDVLNQSWTWWRTRRARSGLGGG